MSTPVAPYDLTHPPLLRPHESRRLKEIACKLAVALSTYGSEYLGCEFSVSFRELREVGDGQGEGSGDVLWAFPDCNSSPRPPVWSLEPEGARGLVGQMVSRRSDPVAAEGPFTGIERRLLAHWCREMQGPWAAAWPGSWRDMTTRWVCISNDIQSLDATFDRWLRLGFDMRVWGVDSHMAIYVAHSEAASALIHAAEAAHRRDPAISPAMSETQVTARVKLGTWSSSLSELVALRPGDVISLGIPAEAPLTLGIEGVDKLPVRAGIRNGRLAVQVMSPPGSADSGQEFVPMQDASG